MRLIDSLIYRFNKLLVRAVMYPIKRHNGKKLKNTRISNTTLLDYKENIDLSDHIFIGHYCFIEGSNGITIEEGVQITNYVSIITHSSHISIRLYGRHYSEFKKLEGYVTGPVRIGKYTFIGPHSVIMPNTNIGKGCIVKAYSYVKGDFPDFSIIEGRPAKVVGTTKDIDKHFIEAFPNLKKFYDEWND